MSSRAWTAVSLLVGSLMALALGRAAVIAQTPEPPSLFLPLIVGGTCGDFFDSFDHELGWFTGEREGLMAETAAGEYRMRITRPGYVWLVGAPDCPRLGYEAAVDARWAGETGNFYGLLFNIHGDLEHAHMLAINSDNRVWLVMAVQPDGLEVLIPPTRHDSIRPGGEVNRLAVAREGERLTLRINDQVVGELPDTAPGTPVIAGLVTASYTGRVPADARFDNFVARMPVPAE